MLKNIALAAIVGLFATGTLAGTDHGKATEATAKKEVAPATDAKTGEAAPAAATDAAPAPAGEEKKTDEGKK